jgi:hypothetical protein
MIIRVIEETCALEGVMILARDSKGKSINAEVKSSPVMKKLRIMLFL